MYNTVHVRVKKSTTCWNRANLIAQIIAINALVAMIETYVKNHQLNKYILNRVSFRCNLLLKNVLTLNKNY